MNTLNLCVFLNSRCIECPMVEEEEYDDQLTDQYLSGNSEPFDDPAAQGVVDTADSVV